jgi:hypothetical protein
MKRGRLVLWPTTIDQSSVEEHHFYDRMTDERTAGRNAEPSKGNNEQDRQCCSEGAVQGNGFSVLAYMSKTLRVHHKSIVMPDPKTILGKFQENSARISQPETGGSH